MNLACASPRRPRTERKSPSSCGLPSRSGLRQLGYSPLATAHAFSCLSGPGTVAEALEVLKDMSRPESPPIALSDY
jgi:hypothetical protein